MRALTTVFSVVTLTVASFGCSKNVSDVGASPSSKQAPSAPGPSQFLKRAPTPPPRGMGAMGRPVAKLAWTLPEGWQEVRPKSRMRRAEFVLPKAKGADEARLAVFHFPGEGGARMANVQRWIGQFKPAPGQKSEPKVEKSKVGSYAVTTVFHKGTYLQSMGGTMMKRGTITERPGFALLAAIVQTPQGPWFFKATGPEATIEHNREAFNKFLQSIGGAKKAAPASSKEAPAAPKKAGS